jgi:hypothetical protein
MHLDRDGRRMADDTRQFNWIVLILGQQRIRYERLAAQLRDPGLDDD